MANLNFNNWQYFKLGSCEPEKFPFPTKPNIVGLVAKPTKYGSLVIVYDNNDDGYGLYAYCWTKKQLYKALKSDRIYQTKARKGAVLRSKIDKLNSKSSNEDIYSCLSFFLRMCCNGTKPEDNIKRFVHNLQDASGCNNKENKRFREFSFIDSDEKNEEVVKTIKFTTESFRELIAEINK